MSDMGTFRTTMMIESAEHRGARATCRHRHRARGGHEAPDYVVFAEDGDMILLGARTLEGLNVRVDAQRKQLVPAGPILAGVAA